MPIPFYQHDLGQAELDSVADVLAGPMLTTGDTVARFETRFAEYLGRRHALALTSCTGGLHLALLALDIGPGDEVVTTPMTFVATATAILSAGAKPVFVDVERGTGNLDAGRVEAALTERTKAIMPVHLYGQMCDMRRLRAIADRHGLAIVEDAAHCIEGRRDGVGPGELAEAAAFSFYATKNLTCGEGGALVTDDRALFERAKLLRLHGVTKTAIDRHKEGYSHWDMVLMGWKYNMSNIEAALLLPQFARIDANLAKRERLAALYERLLPAIGAEVLTSHSNVVHARHVMPVLVPERDRVISRLNAAGVGAVVNYRAIHLLSYFAEQYGYRPGAFPIAEHIGDHVMSLPFYPKLPESAVHEVVAALGTILADLGHAPAVGGRSVA